HQRKTIGFFTIARSVLTMYPRRTVLGLSLFIGQAFLYNAITFGFASILTTFYKVPSADTGYFYVVIAVGNFTGPLLLGKFFYAIGTALGGITGPLLFADLTSSGNVDDTVVAFAIGAAVMTVAGVVAAFLAVPAEQKGLEDIAAPLTSARDGAVSGAPATA